MAGLAAACTGHLGPGLPGWAAALGLVGHLDLGCHVGRRHWPCPALGLMAPGLGIRVGLHPLHDIVVGCFVPLKRLHCMPDNSR